MKQVLTGARIFTGNQFLDNKALVIDGSEIFFLSNDDNVVQDTTVIHLNGGTLAPGFIDLQVNGGGGAFFTNDPSVNTLNTMLEGHRTYGTTSMLPTLISDTRDKQQSGISAVRAAIAQGIAGILGIHIEGPFFDLEKRGAHNAEYIRQISDEDIAWLCDTQEVKTLITLAPEHVQSHQIAQLAQAGIRVSAGHSNAHYEEVKTAIDAGLSGFTHLYNAMRPQTGREPGVVGAALECAQTWCGIICDNHHVHPASVRVACKSKPRGKIYLVTDAMSTVGSPTKSFSLYGETISEKNGALVNAEGRLAGSAIGMIDAVRIAHTSVHLPLDECLRMASLYPAQYMREDHRLGKIAPAFRADLVHFSDDFKVTATWVAGHYQQH